MKQILTRLRFWKINGVDETAVTYLCKLDIYLIGSDWLILIISLFWLAQTNPITILIGYADNSTVLIGYRVRTRGICNGSGTKRRFSLINTKKVTVFATTQQQKRYFFFLVLASRQLKIMSVVVPQVVISGKEKNAFDDDDEGKAAEASSTETQKEKSLKRSATSPQFFGVNTLIMVCDFYRAS